jgi:hypothetical protein
MVSLRWALESGHPLIQQGSSWYAFRGIAASATGVSALSDVEPTIVCETHPQAAASVVHGRGWCIVPTIVARNVQAANVAVWSLASAAKNSDIALVTFPRVLDKFSGAQEATDALKHELGLTLAGVKR